MVTQKKKKTVYCTKVNKIKHENVFKYLLKYYGNFNWFV